MFEAPRRLSGEGVRALAHAELGPSAAVTPKRVRRASRRRQGGESGGRHHVRTRGPVCRSRTVPCHVEPECDHNGLVYLGAPLTAPAGRPHRTGFSANRCTPGRSCSGRSRRRPRRRWNDVVRGHHRFRQHRHRARFKICRLAHTPGRSANVRRACPRRAHRRPGHHRRPAGATQVRRHRPLFDGTTATATFPLAATAPPSARPLDRLHPRELHVLAGATQRLRNRQIAENLHLSEHTVKFHVRNVLDKLGVTSRGEAAALARQLHHPA